MTNRPHSINTIVLAGILTAAIIPFANPQANRLDVNIASRRSEAFSIYWQTANSAPSKCEMEVADMQTSSPNKGEDGFIDITTHTVQPCLSAFGSHSGEITFELDNETTALEEGRYELIINNKSYGVLSVGQTVAVLDTN